MLYLKPESSSSSDLIGATASPSSSFHTILASGNLTGASFFFCNLSMSIAEIKGGKKRKREDRVYKFKTFCEQGNPTQFNRPFRQNVEALLKFGQVESSLRGRMPSWSFQLEVHRHPPFYVLLFVVEEAIETSIHRHCKQCQYVGWGNHMICNKKYHFLLPSKDTMAACLGCEGNCDDGSTKGKFNFLQLQGHIMHGVIHSNGFGHLLCVNGLEVGSELDGHQVMEFWDRLCTGLYAREISLTDISSKRGMDLRLLHGVAYGEPWFGQWGYKFGRGSYNISEQMYKGAIQALQRLPLCLLISHLGTFNRELPIIFSRYQLLSDHALVTLGDLFRFMLDFKSRLPKDTYSDPLKMRIFMETSCRWSPKRVEMATRVIVEALRRAEFKWVSRQEVRDAARAYIGDTGLLDFVLKSLGNHKVGNYIVRRCLNPVTKVLEYCLEDVSNMFPNQDSAVVNNSQMLPRYKITRAQVLKDISYLYRYILKEQKPILSTGIFNAIPMASKIIVDSKYFIKVFYEGELPSTTDLALPEEEFKAYCSIVVKNNVIDNSSNFINQQPILPYECVVVKKNATIEDLKKEVEKCFREIYWGLKSFVVDSIANSNVRASDLASWLIEATSCHRLVFEGIDKNDRGNYVNEGLRENSYGYRIVDCQCGAKEDDGEIMVSCDICEVWQHTRCLRIPDNEIPHIFLCSKCEQDIVLFPSLP